MTTRLTQRQLRELSASVSRRNQLNRRRFLTLTGSAALFSFSAAGISGCGSDSDKPSRQLDSGTIALGGYPDWLGKGELAAFAKQYPGEEVRQVAIAVDDDRIAKLATDPSAVDLMLLIESEVQRIVDLGIAAQVDLNSVPNYANIDSEFKVGYASEKDTRAVATDYGKTGFGYRRDLVDEDLQSWADVWRVASNYSGMITFLNFPLHAIGTALLLNGDDVSSTDEQTLEAAADSLIEIKPHLRSFVDTDLSKGLLDGSAVIAMDWDYDIFLAQQQNQDIQWVAPEDGVQAYLDVWVPISTSERLPVAWDFFDFHYQPKTYANFVNTLGVASCMTEARQYIDDIIAGSPILYPPADVLGRLKYQKALGKAQEIWNEQWQRVKAS